jgi:hypothetical protein
MFALLRPQRPQTKMLADELTSTIVRHAQSAQSQEATSWPAPARSEREPPSSNSDLIVFYPWPMVDRVCIIPPMRSLPVLLLVIAALLSTNTTVWADGPPAAPAAPLSPNAAQRLKTLADHGNRAAEDGRFAEALASYKAAWSLTHTRELACNIGYLERLTGGNTPSAATFLRRCVTWAAPPAASEKERRNRGELAAAFDEVRKDVSGLLIRVTSPGTQAILIDIDGRPITSELGEEIFVIPGTRRITATRGDETSTQTVDALKGKTTTIDLAFKRPPADQPKPPKPPGPPKKDPAKKRDTILVAGEILTASGVTATGAAFALSVAFKSVAEENYAIVRVQSSARCVAQSTACDPFRAKKDLSAALRNVGVGAAIGTAVIAAATIVYRTFFRGARAKPLSNGSGAGIVITW